MQVILLEDVKGVGKKFDTKDVAKGYALNYLLPQKKAREATEAIIQELTKAKEEHQRALETEKSVAREKLINLSEPLIIIARANEQGHLFAGITREIIVERLFEVNDIRVSAEALDLEHALKEVGTHEIPVMLGEETVTLVVDIQAK